jgi:8-oxo-dGTP pyrophosphatase MutT (NUDIX family)
MPPMHRRHVLKLLADHAARRPDQAATAARIRALVEAHEDCLLRTCVPGHVTASAWVVTPDGRRTLLTHHKKLERWLQLGGHTDGEARIERAALREAQEESGLPPESLSVFAPTVEPRVLDVDVHVIPARRDEPEHEHHDVRFLIVADREREPVVSDESHDVRWFNVDDVRTVTGEDSVLRLVDAGLALLAEGRAPTR